MPGQPVPIHGHDHGPDGPDPIETSTTFTAFGFARKNSQSVGTPFTYDAKIDLDFAQTTDTDLFVWDATNGRIGVTAGGLYFVYCRFQLVSVNSGNWPPNVTTFPQSTSNASPSGTGTVGTSNFWGTPRPYASVSNLLSASNDSAWGNGIFGLSNSGAGAATVAAPVFFQPWVKADAGAGSWTMNNSIYIWQMDERAVDIASYVTIS